MDVVEGSPGTDDAPMLVGVAKAGAGPKAVIARPSVLAETWGGAKLGFWVMTIVVGSIAALVLLFGLTVTVFGLGTRRGLGIHSAITGSLLVYMACTSIGVFLGAAIGLVPAMLRCVSPGAGPPAWWSALHRPIRPRRESKQAAMADEIDPLPTFSRRWPRIVGAFVIAVLALAFGAGLYVGRVVDQRLGNAMAAATRDDPAWQIDDLMANREPVPDAENGAIVVADALARLPRNWPSAPPPAPGARRSPPTDAEQAFDRMEVADNVRLDEAAVATLRAELERYRDAVGLARTVADYRRGRHELVLGPTLIDTLLPETHRARQAARLLTADAAIRAHDGDVDGALDSSRAILGVARSIGDEPFLISQLVRVVVGTMATKAAQRALAQGEPSDAALERLQALVVDELDQPLLLQGVKGERAVLSEVFRRMGTGEISDSAPTGDRSQADRPGRRGAIAPWGRIWFDYQRAVGIEIMNEAVAIARRPIAERPRRWKRWEEELEQSRHGRLGQFIARLPLDLVPAVQSTDSSCSRYSSELGAVALLLAAERQRRKTAEWPASISAIEPAILPRPPLDPFTGQPYRVIRRDGQFIVYSIGPNLIDEHGACDPKRWSTGGPDDVNAAAWDPELRRQPAIPAEPEGASQSGADGPEASGNRSPSSKTPETLK